MVAILLPHLSRQGTAYHGGAPLGRWEFGATLDAGGGLEMPSDMRKRCIELRFYEELNDFLPPGRRKRRFPHYFHEDLTVERLLAVYGIPGALVDLVLANEEPVNLAHVLQDGESVSVYPVFESFDITGITGVRAEPLRRSRFAAVNLERLVYHLRLFGFDAVSADGFRGGELARLLDKERRVLLYRDRGQLPHRGITRCYEVRALKPRLQLIEVLKRLDLSGSISPLTRCVSCNAVLAPPSEAHTCWCLRCAGRRRVCSSGIHLGRLRLFVSRVVSSGALAE
jgi:uncharacterized protein with PIN domain